MSFAAAAIDGRIQGDTASTIDAALPDALLRIEQGNRHAKLFDVFLYDADPPAFAVMTRAIFEGQRFAAAAKTWYRTDLDALWLRFVQSMGRN